MKNMERLAATLYLLEDALDNIDFGMEDAVEFSFNLLDRLENASLISGEEHASVLNLHEKLANMPGFKARARAKELL